MASEMLDDPISEVRSSHSHSTEKRKKKKHRSEKSEQDGESRSHRHKSTRKSKLSSIDTDSHSSLRRHAKDGEDGFSEMPTPSSVTDLAPELRSRVSSMPYPSFSKVHSKENVHSKEDLSKPTKTDPPTPETTDIGSKSELRRSKSARHSEVSRKSSLRRKEERPPTPPDTDLSKQQGEGSITASKLGDERPRSRLSAMSKSTARESKSKVSVKSSKSKASTIKPYQAHVEDADSTISDERTTTSVRRKSTKSSSKRKSKRAEIVEAASQSPDSAPDSSPKTPTQAPPFPPPPPALPHEKAPGTPGIIAVEDPDVIPVPPPMPSQTPMTDFGLPPPPPPPPPLNIQEMPRVDYLMRNGGLSHTVPRTFLSVIPRQSGTRLSNPPLTGCETLFTPFFNLLEQYQTVLNKHGSIAVATGHRTVARRLLDRLENVFSRDLSPAGCSCVMCEESDYEHRGLGWGEVLERVSGRIDLPQWPPFDLATLGSSAAEAAGDIPARPSSPIKLDPDIAPEFREHYLRQSKKVRAAVDKWMSKNEQTAPPPQEVDDETLTFAILTNLEQDRRPYFNALLAGSHELQPALRAPTPMRKPRSDFIVKSGLSLQRLYRLSQAPRDAETAVYLVNNPDFHDLIVTISDINPSEWEILTSGRFDGFLWSGADSDDVLTPTAENPSRGATPASGFFPTRGMTPSIRVPSTGPGMLPGSRTTTPFGPYSRGTTPASFVSFASTNATGRGQAVSNDEETELAVLAEVEREIYTGMEALEDAFETLHHRAEMVRTALRNRGAALSISLQHRRAGGGIDILPQSGGSAYSSGYERPAWATGEEESESDWGGDDFELRPDDSASNISSNRHRKVKRRDERRTPAPIQEED